MNTTPSNKTLHLGTNLKTIKKDMLEKLRLIFFVLVAGSVIIVSGGIFFLEFDVKGILFIMIPIWAMLLTILFAFVFNHRLLSVTIDEYYLSVEKITFFGHKKNVQIPRNGITIDIKEYVHKYHGLTTYLVIRGHGKRVNIGDKEPGWNINHLQKICDCLGVVMA